MKKIERILNNLENGITALFALIVGLVSYIFINAEKLPLYKNIILGFGFVFLSSLVVVAAIFYAKYFKKLED